ncbi:MAG: hypothetical protein JW909_10905 [Planctomycetes bacterium]|nr:hypothetical protein [Planctomycetota bacterium]
MSAELRYTLAAFFLVAGATAIYQKLRPVSVGGKPDTAKPRRMGMPGMLGIVSLGYVTALLAMTVAFTEAMTVSALGVARWCTGLTHGYMLEAGLVPAGHAGEPVGPIDSAGTVPALVLALFPALLVPAGYVLSRLYLHGHQKIAGAAGGILLLSGILAIPFSVAGVRVAAGDVYRESLSDWLDTMEAQKPDARLWGMEGPIVLEGTADQYRPVEEGILFRRWVEMSETGETSQSEGVYPFRMGPFTIEVGNGKKYRVEGLRSVDRVIVVNERLRVGGYLSGGAVESGPGMPVVLMKSTVQDWREVLRSIWAEQKKGTKVLVYVALSCYVYMLTALSGLLVFFAVRGERIGVNTPGEEQQ